MQEITLGPISSTTSNITTTSENLLLILNSYKNTNILIIQIIVNSYLYKICGNLSYGRNN